MFTYFVNSSLLHVLYLLKEALALRDLVLCFHVIVDEMIGICFNYA